MMRTRFDPSGRSEEEIAAYFEGSRDTIKSFHGSSIPLKSILTFINEMEARLLEAKKSGQDISIESLMNAIASVLEGK